MQIADITKKMIAYSEGNTHDINHFLKVWSFARTIGQEKEGMPLAEAFLKDCGLSPEDNARIVYLVGHHHTLEDIRGMDYQILIEADYIVNADESHYSIENIRHFREQIFRTQAGKAILDSIYLG